MEVKVIFTVVKKLKQLQRKPRRSFKLSAPKKGKLMPNDLSPIHQKRETDRLFSWPLCHYYIRF